jgi:hypothetical protein
VAAKPLAGLDPAPGHGVIPRRRSTLRQRGWS